MPVATSFSVGRARELLDEGRRREALEALERCEDGAVKSVPGKWWYDGTVGDLALVELPLETLAEIRELAVEAVRASRFGAWEDDVRAGFERLAADCEQEAEQIRATATARSRAKREREQRRRLKKAMALCVAMPLVLAFCLGASLEESAVDLHASTLEWVSGLVVAPLLAGLLSGWATLRLWRRDVRSDWLYSPFLVGFTLAIAVAVALVS